MKYPKEYLEEIKSRLKVSTVVSKYFAIKKRGKEYVGLSPFKNEKTPSFTINDEKGFYHCFSTGEHGNIFDFLMKTQNLKFGEAVRSLANLAGLQPYRFTKQDEQREKDWNIYTEMYSSYIESNKKNLTSNYIKNKKILDYLKKRNLDSEIIKEFDIGYIPFESKTFTKMKNVFDEKSLIDSGLFYLDERKNEYVDRFRGRLIFPIYSLTGKPIAIGGRIIEDNKKFAKYVNSPETNFFKKGNNLYNLNKARKVSSKFNEVYLVEGYMDVVSLYGNKIFNCVANLGTALTNKQILLLGQFFSEIIICFDGDESGYKAALRAAENSLKFLQPEKQISFLFLPDGEDPDSFVKSKGKEQFLTYSKNNKIQIHSFIFNHYINNSKKTPTELAMIEKKLINLANTIEDGVVKKYLLGFFLEQLTNFLPYKISFKNKNYKSRVVKSLDITKNIYNETKKYSSAEIKEFSLLYIILNNLDFFYHRLDLLNDLLFFSQENKILFQLVEQSLKNGDFSEIKIDNKFLDNINKFATVKHIVKKNDKNHSKLIEIFEDIKKDLKTYGLELRIQELESKFAEDFNQTTFDEIRRLKKEQNIN
tara:strand:+ start:218 stop:1990 length:1773 start_codon:yes stop_codon:yes gene_type:complete